MRILFLIDEGQVPPDNPQFEGRWDPGAPSMEHHVIQAARRCGHAVSVMGAGDDARDTLRGIQKHRPHVVFNLVEECFGNRRLAAHIPALLEILAVPFTGCSSMGLTLSCDKVLASLLAEDVGLPVPGFAAMPPGTTRLPRPLRYPVIVKPRFGDGSEGVSLASVVHNAASLARRVKFIHRRFAQDAICQEYIEGREISVGILGNRRLIALPPRETVFGKSHAGGPRFATERVKDKKAYSEKWKISYSRAMLTPEQEKAAAAIAKSAYRRLGLSGYGRIDFRIDNDGQLFFIEANGNPDIRPRVFGIMAAWAGIEYPRLIQLLIDFALRAYRRHPGHSS
jgi:D-alanine-D-alanine ligase